MKSNTSSWFVQEASLLQWLWWLREVSRLMGLWLMLAKEVPFNGWDNGTLWRGAGEKKLYMEPLKLSLFKYTHLNKTNNQVATCSFWLNISAKFIPRWSLCGATIKDVRNRIAFSWCVLCHLSLFGQSAQPPLFLPGWSGLCPPYCYG